MKFGLNIFLVPAILLVVSWRANSQTALKINFKSKMDRFEVLLNDNTVEVDGKTYPISNFKDFRPLLTNDLGEECPEIREAPDVTVTIAGQPKPRNIHITQGVITDGDKCLYVSGEGLMYFPLHRSWLTENKAQSIKLGKRVSVIKDEQKIVTFERKGKNWVQSDTEFHPDWDFLDKFEATLKEFTVLMHANKDLAKGKPMIAIESDGKTYKLYHVSSTQWALEAPKAKWLIISNDWGVWFNLETTQFEDHRANKIRFILDKAKEPQDRIEALDNLQTGWSRSLRDMYARLLLDSSEPASIHKISLERLRTKPTLENAGVIVQFLEVSTDDNLRKMATQILRIQNPKGPIFDAKKSASQQLEVVKQWSQWWKKVRPAP